MDDNFGASKREVVEREVKRLKTVFELDDLGELMEYVGCKVDVDREKRTAKFTQPVMIQSFKDEFGAGKVRRVTPAEPGTMLPKVTDESQALSAAKQAKYRSGVGKMMHMMRWSRLETYNSVRDCARHMKIAGEDHYEAMIRLMDYCISNPERGLLLAPKGNWDGRDAS